MERRYILRVFEAAGRVLALEHEVGGAVAEAEAGAGAVEGSAALRVEGAQAGEAGEAEE